MEAAKSGTLRGLSRKLLMCAVASRDGGKSAQGVKWWLQYCLNGTGLPPVQHIDSTSPRWEKLEAEARLMDFCTWLVVCRPSGRPISPSTARKYASHVVTWMRRNYSADFAGGLDLVNLRDLIKGMRRELGESPKRERYGVRTQDLRAAMDKSLPRGSSRNAQAWRAALTAAFCGLLRGCEFALPDGEAFNPERHLTRADVKFKKQEDGTWICILTIHQAKNANQLNGKHVTVFLVGGGSIIDPVRELATMIELDPVAPEDEAVTPLFRDARDKSAFTRHQAMKMVKGLMQSIGLDPARFGAHSLRIGGATAALAAGIHPTVIRLTGRWASDVWMIYARMTKQAALRVSAVIGSTAFEDAERGFQSEELETTAAEAAALRGVDFGVDGYDSGGSEDEA